LSEKRFDSGVLCLAQNLPSIEIEIVIEYRDLDLGPDFDFEM